MYFICIQNQREQKVPFSLGETVLSALAAAEVSASAPCAGNGSCGKCKVKLNCFTAPTVAEKRFLTASELENGIRLACQTPANENMRVFLSDGGEIFSAEIAAQPQKQMSRTAVVDIGTTTVTAALVNEISGEILKSVTRNNSQSSFGADVISRIKASADDGGRQHELIVSQIREMLASLGRIEHCVVTGNTTMLHLVFGVDCRSIGEYPYKAAFLDSRSEKIGGIEFVSPPCIHSFVGADVSCGIASVYENSDDYTLLIDIGTNAEIALFNREKLFAASAAAGPAFEGARIRCGSAAVAGALCGFSLKNAVKRIDTIGGVEPTGICGSGLIDIAAALVESGIIDETGAFADGAEKYPLSGEIALYASDVRELQLAKAAVATAVTLLLKRAEVNAENVGRVLLSGGFGSFLNVKSAATIGLIPAELAEKSAAVGNSALAGAALYASGRVPQAVKNLISAAKVLDLATDTEFTDSFVDNLLFKM